MITALGHSNNPTSAQAVREILAQCQAEPRLDDPGLGIFLTSRMDLDFQAALDGILRTWPNLQLVGCTTDGEISDIFPCTENSLSLLLIQSDRVFFSTGLGENLSRDPEAAVRQALAGARAGAASKLPELGLVFCDGLESFRIDPAAALRRNLGETFPVVGGYAGDHYQMVKTFQFFGNQVVSDALVLVLVHGPVLYSFGCDSGWRPIGRPFVVNRCVDNVIYEIDGMPALDFFRKHLGNNQEEYAQVPLAVSVGQGEYVLRDPYSVNTVDKSILCCGTFPDTPRPPRIRLTEYDRESLVDAANRATLAAERRYPGNMPDLALLFPCTSRRHILGTRAALEHDALLRRKTERPAMRIFGMYAYGEICPIRSTGVSCHHNDTYVVLLLGEEA